MTECERLIETGIIEKNFLDEEEICGVNVPVERKKVWAIELDLYKEFERVCEKNNLSFFTDGGTTIGAVRHSGFIPWDDDIDVCMPRADFDKLFDLNDEFEAPYFLQTWKTDTGYAYPFIRLVNVNTTALLEKFQHRGFKQCIYIDIFPLDYVKKEEYIEQRQQINDLIMLNSGFMRENYPEKTMRDEQLVLEYKKSGMNYLNIIDEINTIAKRNSKETTKYLSLIVSTQYRPECKIWPRELFDDYILFDFSGIKVRVPQGYDEQLRIYFGDYMTMPKEEERQSTHDTIFYPDLEYDTYCNMKGGK